MFELGFVLFSKNVVQVMIKMPEFAKFVGDSLGRHLRGDTGRLKKPKWMEVPAASMYRFGDMEIQVSTELDKNSMPRTSVVFPEESGHL